MAVFEEKIKGMSRGMLKNDNEGYLYFKIIFFAEYRKEWKFLHEKSSIFYNDFSKRTPFLANKTPKN
jgi:hypothetical protein